MEIGALNLLRVCYIVYLLDKYQFKEISEAWLVVTYAKRYGHT